MIVKDLMSLDPVCVEPETEARDALELMIDEGIHHLPVVDGHRHVVGVLSIGDLAATLWNSLGPPWRLPDRAGGNDAFALCVRDVMSYSPIVVRSTAKLLEAARSVVRNGIGCLPVVDEEGRIEGIVSESDLLEACVAMAPDGGMDRPPSALGGEERLIEAIRGEEERLSRSLAMYDEVAPEFARARLQSLGAAVARAGRGELHSCSRCRGKISASRLRALPGTTLCSRCAREMAW